MEFEVDLPEHLQTTALLARRERARVEAKYIAPWIKPSAHGINNVLDIGCGAAITSIMLARELKFDRLLLMDGQQGLYTNGYKLDTKAWEDTNRARAVAELNLNSTAWSIVEPDQEFRGSFTFIMSLISWCHHYPVEVYLPMVKASLIPGGRLVVDIRKTARVENGLTKLLNSGFIRLAILDETKKCTRYVLERN